LCGASFISKIIEMTILNLCDHGWTVPPIRDELVPVGCSVAGHDIARAIRAQT
jgi:hypothetical protein